MTDPTTTAGMIAGVLPHIRDALADGTPRNTHAIAAAVDQALGPDRAVSTPVVADAIEHLAANGIVEHTDAGWTLTRPDLHGDNLATIDAARQAIEGALASAPKNNTLEAKARHVHETLMAAGWWFAIPDPGHDLVQIRTEDQHVITVPDGWTFDVRPEDPVVYGPGDQLIDPELSELSEIVARLEALDPDARERIVDFVTHRYGTTTPAAWPFTSGPWLTPTEARERVTASARQVAVETQGDGRG